MDGSIALADPGRSWSAGAPFEVLRPDRRSVPLVVASPHSGSTYPPEFVSASRLDPLSLRRSEDSFVDELFEGTLRAGAPLIRAHFPRAYVDLNREPFELDPRMFEDSLPAYVTTRSPRVSAGLGTIARVVGTGQEIYSGKLRFADALHRINTLYIPYHRSLRALVDETREQFGYCVLIDAHSMPSNGTSRDWELGASRVDMVLGDCHGTSCAPELTDAVQAALAGMGYTVTRNEPYPGGYTTRHHGRPRSGIHALQIEVNRGLYMNEDTFERTDYFPVLASHVTELIRSVSTLPALHSARRSRAERA